MKHGLTTGLMLASMVFILCLCFFFWGCILIWKGTVNLIWLWIVVLSFVFAIPALVCIVKYKSRLNLVMLYGEPLRRTGEYIVQITHETGKYSVKKLRGILEKVMKEKIDETLKEKGGE